MRKSLLLVVLLSLIGSACTAVSPREVDPAVPPATLIATVAPPQPEVFLPSATPSPAPGASLPPSSTPAPTRTFTATPTPHPMDILAMRRGSYPGSDITIVRELTAAVNYHRYYASYQSEGLTIYALLTVPNGEPPPGGWPAIVFNHGYIPPEIYRTTERYIAYVDRLARAGYIVFRIDYRGNDQSEGIAPGAYGDPGYTVDVLNAVASLQRFPLANPNKIGMWGHSMGGFLTLRAMVISPAIKAGVIWSGVVGDYSDMMYRWRRTGYVPTQPASTRRWRTEWVKLYGTPAQNPAFWNSISANAFLADLSGPLQLHHGTADEEVPLEFSQKLAAEVQAAGGSAELFTYEGADHNLSQPFTLAMDRTIQFFDQHLK